MKVLHTADWHLGKLLEGRSRLVEQREVLGYLTHKMQEKKPDMVVIAGDVFDNSNPSAQAEELFYEMLKAFGRDGECLVVVVGGNHDQPLRLEAVRPLAKEHGILIYGTPKSEISSGRYGKYEITSLGEGAFSFSCEEEKVIVVCAAYPSEKRLNEVLYTNNEEDERIADYMKRMEQWFLKCDQHFEEGAVNLMVSHVYTFGSTPDGSERSVQLGGSYILPANIFPEHADYIALGHVHKPQKVPGTDGRICYSGSILPYHKGEHTAAKSCRMVTMHPGEAPVPEEIYLPNPKPIELWKCESYEEALEKCRENANRSCWVYMQIRTDGVILEDQLKALKQEKEDILEIIPVWKTSEKEYKYTDWKQKSVQELFEVYYKEVRGSEAVPEEITKLLNVLLEEEEDETITVGDDGN